MASPTNQLIARLNTFYYPPEGTQICYSWEAPLFAFPFPINLLHLTMDLSLDFYIRARVVSCPFFCLAWRQFKEHRRMKNTHLGTWSLFASSTVAFPLALTMLLTPTQNTAANVVFQTCSFLTRYIFIFLSHMRQHETLIYLILLPNTASKPLLHHNVYEGFGISTKPIISTRIAPPLSLWDHQTQQSPWSVSGRLGSVINIWITAWKGYSKKKCI